MFCQRGMYCSFTKFSDIDLIQTKARIKKFPIVMETKYEGRIANSVDRGQTDPIG